MRARIEKRVLVGLAIAAAGLVAGAVPAVAATAQPAAMQAPAVAAAAGPQAQRLPCGYRTRARYNHCGPTKVLVLVSHGFGHDHFCAEPGDNNLNVRDPYNNVTATWAEYDGRGASNCLGGNYYR